MRYVIVGAGAIGGTLSARLAQHLETPPLVIARGDNAEAIRARGLLLRSPDDEVRVDAPVATDPREAELTTDDVLVFATKTHQVQSALLEWVDEPVRDAAGEVVGTAGELLPVLTALNGVESERLALRYFRRVFGVCVWLPAVHLAPGEFTVRIAPQSGVFIVGRYGLAGEADAAADALLLGTVQSDWERATFRVHVVDEVMPWKYRKLVSNLGNAVQALIGTGDEASSPTAGELYSLAREEGLAVYAAAGIGIPSDDDEERWRGGAFDVRPVTGADGPLGGSTWQSLARGSGSIETDYLNGEIVRLARLAGVPAPVNEGLQRLARQAAAEHRPPASVSPDELKRILLGG
ncbi:ketopantoate reductase family protein [Gryllotalpicola protaetiae]|uniref:2-dehydropantoate 2-reductase n=1 Tax=Gryllotalpicola protaetiae TaxID=2419771 RepID=A0A387BIZ9_9MICO|nr:2-dehydropantoate 2-reductase N-terminal domain-containing protein [Gryllotalpicola protaetiae]AYG03793.1 2-dehydropantoate 2-reductase [Gryllotalpicola protaetiae]